MIHDDRRCELGEGPLWHPTRAQLYWFDILNRRLLTRSPAGGEAWEFPGMVSAAGWIDDDSLLVASEAALLRFDLASGAMEPLAALEADDPRTRSNDGRADPWGGFWIGTMGKRAEPGAGSIWRFHRGQVRRLMGGITIPNAIAFAPDGHYATFTDTPTRQVMRLRLGRDGWPVGEAEVMVDLRPEGLKPDGAVFDAEGCLWIAQWGAGRVARHGADGQFLESVAFPAPHTSCPAFGGEDLSTLYVTTALEGMDEAARAAHPHAGAVFAADAPVAGRVEHQVVL